MTKALDIDRDVLAIACALSANSEAFKQATRFRQNECYVVTDPAEKIVEWSLAIARGLDARQHDNTRG